MTESEDGQRAGDILKRIDADQSLVGREARGAQIDENDPVEARAKQIGRVVGYALLVILAVNLFTGWFF